MTLTNILAGAAVLASSTVVTLVGGFNSSAQAYQFYIGQDSTVDFEFLESHGSYKSALKLYDEHSNALTLFAETKAYDTKTHDYASYCGAGKSIATCFVSHLLAKGTYYLGLDSGSKGISYDAQAVGNNLYDGLKLGFEDHVDSDYNDFIVYAKASPTASTPEPSGLIGASLVGMMLIAARRRQSEA